MHQFFVEDCQIGEKYVTITGTDVRHIKQVLRMRPGETIRVSSQTGKNMLCSVTEVADSFVSARIMEESADTELPARIILFQGMAKGERMETVIEKAVELGVTTIVPVATKYCVVRLDQKKAAAKQKRWQAIAESAAKQSKRSRIPDVEVPVDFATALKMAEELDQILVPYENERGMEGTKEALAGVRPDTSIGVFVGPEGGFAPEEIEALPATAELVSLGRRILRTETAAITMLSLLMMQLEL